MTFQIEGGYTANGQVVHRIYTTTEYRHDPLSVCTSDPIDTIVPIDPTTTDLRLCKRCFNKVRFI